MADAASTSNDADLAAQRAAEQARLRKEKREAKIRAGGSARLNKITGMDDRVVGETTFVPPPVATTASEHADPEEVDISQHHYEPATTARAQQQQKPPMTATTMSEAQLRQVMLSMDRPGQTPSPNPSAAAGSFPNMPPPGGAPGTEEDPITKMMTQLMSGQGIPGMGAGGDGASPFAGGMAGLQQQQQQAATPDPYTSLWRVIHALVALGLGVYVALLTAFSGTKYEREREAIAYDTVAEDANRRHKDTFFWVFATAETLLLTTRFYLDKRRGPPPGMVATALGYVPQPYRSYVETVMRYGTILTTVRTDILGCMFVLGLCAWWRS